jgi:hypothetical protein
VPSLILREARLRLGTVYRGFWGREISLKTASLCSTKIPDIIHRACVKGGKYSPPSCEVPAVI